MDRNTVLIRKFFSHCRYEARLADKTLYAYAVDMRQFRSFLASEYGSMRLAHVTKPMVRRYVASLAARYKPSSCKRKIATLKSFYGFLERESLVAGNPARALRLKFDRGKRLPKVIAKSDLRKLFRAAYAQRDASKNDLERLRSVRDVAVLELLFATGMRVSELCTLRFEMVNMKEGTVRIKGKGDKERLVPICIGATRDAVREYLEERGGKRSLGEYVFSQDGERPLSDQAVRYMLRGYAAKAGIATRITPHMFRHTVATMLLDNGVDIRNIQYLLGHSSITVTEKYVHVSNKSQENVMLAKHPRRALMRGGER